MNVGGVAMTHEMAATAAARGENWLRFFLHPDSDFTRSMTGALEKYPLSSSTLPAIARLQRQANLHNADPLPAYARTIDSFQGIICHIGVGGFHRSHEAVYTHQLLLDQMDRVAKSKERWGIVGVGLMPWDKGMKDVLAKQDNLYSVMGRDSESTTGMVVGSIVGFVYAPDDPTGNNVIERLAHAQTRIVSLTVTEKGYCLDNQGKLDLSNAMVRHDLENPHERCQTAVGTICKALAVRMGRGLEPFTVMSCDNLPGNGHLSQGMVMGFLEAKGDAELTGWVKEGGSFPNTMVDRITPATRPLNRSPDAVPDAYSDGIRTLVRETCGLEDDWPVIAEQYTQWVIEDKFVLGRPAWEERGALFTSDVEPYEHMKLRLLNAGHSAISYCSYLVGHRYVDCAMDPKQLGGSNPVPDFCEAFFEEQTPTVPPVPGVDMVEYKKQLVKRFSNPYIKDMLQRLAEDGSQKLVTTMRDAALENQKAGRSNRCFAFVVATWVRYLVGVDEQGAPIEIKDPLAAELTALARDIFNSPEGTLPLSPPQAGPVTALLRRVFGDQLVANDAVVGQINAALADVVATSTLASMMKVVAESK